jgi:hypothetical protein
VSTFFAAKSEKGYYWVMKRHPHIRFISSSWGTEEEIIFSRAVAKYQDIVISTIKNN